MPRADRRFWRNRRNNSPGGLYDSGNIHITRRSNPPDRNTAEFISAFRTSPRLAVTDRIATDLSFVPGKLYRVGRDGQETEVTRHAFLDFWEHPNPLWEYTRPALWRLLQLYLLLKGEGYFIIERDHLGRPCELWPVPVHYTFMTPYDGHPYYLLKPNESTMREIHVNDVFVMKRLNPFDPSWRGLGQAEALADEIEIDEYAGKFQKRFFANDATPNYAVVFPDGSTSKDIRERFRAEWLDRFRGVEKSHGMATIAGDVRFEKLSEGMKDLEMVEGRTYLRDACLEHFGVPREIMGITESSNRATSEAAQYIYAQTVLTPEIRTREQAINEQLLPAFDPDGTLVWRFDAIVPRNEEFDKAKALEGWNSGLFTKNESRELMGMDAVEGGDVYKTSFADMFIRDTDDPVAATAAAGNLQFADIPMADPEDGIEIGIEEKQRPIVIHTKDRQRKTVTLQQLLRSEQEAARESERAFEVATIRFLKQQAADIRKALGGAGKSENIVFDQLDQYILPDGSFDTGIWLALPEEQQWKLATKFSDQLIDWDAFKDETATNFVENFSKAIHRTPGEIQSVMVKNKGLWKEMGVTGEKEADKLSETLTSVSYDMAKTFNTDEETLSNKMFAAIRGNSKALDEYGIALSDTVLEEEKQKMGLKGKLKDLDDATMAQVRLNAIMAQTKDTQGQAAKEATTLKGAMADMKGVLDTFVGDAGAKIAPIISKFANTLIELWPKIEPGLMALVDLLADGLGECLPIIGDLAQDLLPGLVDIVKVAFEALKPLLPMLGPLIKTILPPLAEILGVLVENLMPPLVDIIGSIIPIIEVLMPPLMQIVKALLPPLCSLLKNVSPLLDALSPILELIGSILVPIAEVLSKIIGWVSKAGEGISKFLGKITGGAKKGREETQGLNNELDTLSGKQAEASVDVDTSNLDKIQQDIEKKTKSGAETAMDSAEQSTKAVTKEVERSNKEIEKSSKKLNKSVEGQLKAISDMSQATYDAVGAHAEKAWLRSVEAARVGTGKIVGYIGQVNGLGTVSVSVSDPIPHHAMGTPNFDGWIVSNQPPGAPGSVTVAKNHAALGANQVLAERPLTISWTHATDVDNTSSQLTYSIQRNYDEEKTSGAGLKWTTIASGISGTSHTINAGIPKNAAKKVQYRVVASDPYIQSTEGTTSVLLTVISNSPPTTPGSITVAAPPLEKGGPVNVSWAASTDPDGNLTGYKLERSTNGGTSWTAVVTTNASTRTWSGTLGSWATVMYRVKAYDTFDEESGYRTSQNFLLRDKVSITVAQDASSGLKNGQTYTTDAARTVVFQVAKNLDPSMTEKYTTKLARNGTLLESKTAVITGGLYTHSLNLLQWQCLLNGSQTYTLTVTDSLGNSAQASVAFTKNVTQIIVETDPFPVEIAGGIIRNFLISVLGQFPTGSSLTVKITNNAKDAAPVWQTLTNDQLNGAYWAITNTTVTKGNWFAVRVEADRGTSSAVRIDQISGVAGMSQTFILAEDNKQLREDFDTKALKLLGSVTNYASLPTAPDIRLVGGIWKANDTDKYWSWTGDEWIEVLREFDTAPTQGSENGVTSGGVFTALQNGLQGVLKYKGTVASYANLPPSPAQWDLWKCLDTDKHWYWDGDDWHQLNFTLVMDNTPTENSVNAVTSGGVYAALEALGMDIPDLSGILTRLDAIEAALADTAGALDPANP